MSDVTPADYQECPLLAGKRLYLRGVEPQDLECFRKAVNDPEIRRYLMTIEGPLSYLHERDWYDQLSKNAGRQKTLSIILKEPLTLIGNLSLMSIDQKHGHAELGAMICDEAHRGKGYGEEAQALILEHAFDEMNLYRVYVRIASTNPRSLACAKKAGFVQEGVQRGAIKREGKRIDLVLLSILESEWRERHQ